MVETVGRVFAAVPLPNEIRMALADQISGLDIPGRLVPVENWHLTLRFLGTVDRIAYERFLHGLSEVETHSSFRVRFNGFGGFPKTKKATVSWVGVDSGMDELEGLNEIAERAAQSVGLAPEERPFRPHLTLSRIRPPMSIDHLVDEPLDLRFAVSEVVVYRSHLGIGRARYEPLEIFSL